MSELCTRCRNFDIQAFPKNGQGYKYRLYPKADVIREAASCSFCSMIFESLMAARDGDKSLFDPSTWPQLKKVIQGESSLAEIVSRSFRWQPAISSPWIYFHVMHGNNSEDMSQNGLNITCINASIGWKWKKSRGRCEIKLHVAADSGTPAYVSGDITGKLMIETSTTADSYIDEIKSWHSKCAQEHDLCKKTLSRSASFNAEDVPLPSRCYRIGSRNLDALNNATPQKQAHLVETSGKRGKYITLSHRWDTSTEAAKTLKANVNCRLGHCNICGHSGVRCPNDTDPSPLFQEAATLAAKLGVDYIWIDSLCIVQDDPSDWEREAVKMADYYQYSWLTICATTAADGGGISRPVQPASMPRIARLPYRNSAGDQQGYFYVQSTGGMELAKDYKKYIAQGSLLKRGWVYQEWMLSRRLLAFSATGVFVQCQQDSPTSIFGGDVFERRQEEGIREEKLPSLVDLAFKDSFNLSFSTKEEIFRSWGRVVEAYSGLGLTMIVSDRLIALAGVAKEFGLALKLQDEINRPHMTVGHRYISGLWHGDICGLLWEQVEDGTRVRVEGIPSWSWASISTRVLDSNGIEICSGMAVRWSKMKTWNRLRHKSPKSSKVEIICKAEGAFTVELDQKMKPKFRNASSIPPDDEYGISGRFVMLRLHTKLIGVIIDGSCVSKEEQPAMVELTAYGSDFGMNMWRRVASDANCSILRGWASIEHPNFQKTSTDQIQTIRAVYALLMTKIPQAYGGYGFGKLSKYQPCFQVIYARAVHVEGFSDTYERLGVGRLFGYDVEACFGSTEGQSVWLV